MVLTYKREHIAVQNFSSLEDDERARGKRVWSPRAKRSLQWPNTAPQLDQLYDGKYDMAKESEKSPRRYRIMSSKSHRFATTLSLQSGDARYFRMEPAHNNQLGPGSYDREHIFSDAMGCSGTSMLGTSSFFAPQRPEMRLKISPDTGDAHIVSDWKAWQSGPTMSSRPRETDVATWKYGIGRVVKERETPNPPFCSPNNSTNKGSLVSELISPAMQTAASFKSTTARLATLPNMRTSDRRPTRGLQNRPRSQNAEPKAKIWNGRDWVLPAQFMRERSKTQNVAASQPASLNIGKLRRPVTSDGFYVFTEMRKGLQTGTAAMRSQGRDPMARSIYLDSSLLGKR